LLTRANDTIKFIENPNIFMNKYIGEKIDSHLMNGVFDKRGHLTAHGVTVAQETYDFLFDKTLGESRFYSQNPIINAIQGVVADEIRRFHSDTIFQAEQLVDDIHNLSDSLNSTDNQTQSFKPRPISSKLSNSECSILDGTGASDLAIDDPERFENLIKRCNKK
jgi:hypothetical protein